VRGGLREKKLATEADKAGDACSSKRFLVLRVKWGAMYGAVDTVGGGGDLEGVGVYFCQCKSIGAAS
jgi:hypothetical protein